MTRGAPRTAGDPYKAFELAPKILAGIVNINSPTVNDEIHAPMDGCGTAAGVGRGRTGTIPYLRGASTNQGTATAGRFDGDSVADSTGGATSGA